MSIIERAITELLQEAVWAPSGDNSQPWEFLWRDAALEVFCIPDKDNKILNFNFTGTYIAVGALVENIDIIARGKGLKATHDYFPDKKYPRLVARIRFELADATPDPLATYIRERCTNRKPYDPQPLSDEQRNQIIGGITQAGTDLKLLEDREAKAVIAKACSVMEQVALETRSLHHLFFSSLVWSREEESRKGGGLYVKTLELPPPILGLFKIVRYWPVTAFLNGVGFSKVAAAGNAKVYAASASLGAIVISDSHPTSFVLAGRAFERLWLTVTRLRLSLQPVTGVTFLFQRLDAGQLTMLSERHIAMVAEAQRQFTKAYNLKDYEIIAMHFRIGHAVGPTARSFRRPPKMRSEYAFA